MYFAGDHWEDYDDWDDDNEGRGGFNYHAADDFLIADDPALLSDEFSGPEDQL